MSSTLQVNILTIIFTLLQLLISTSSTSSFSWKTFSCSNLNTTCSCVPSVDAKFEVDCMNIVPQNHPYLKVFYQPMKLLHLHCYKADRQIFDASIDEEKFTYEIPSSNPLSMVNYFEIFPATDVTVHSCHLTDFITTIEKVFRKAKPSKISFTYIDFDSGEFPNYDNAEGLENVTYISLQHSYLVNIPYDFLSKMPKLKQVCLNFNEFVSVPAQFNRNVQNLELGSNNISYIHPDALKGLNRLLLLHLWGNKIEHLQDGVFDDLEQIESLELSRNLLTELSPTIFAKLPRLYEINLGNNQLTELPENIFWNNGMLNSIRLERNKLSKLSSGLFKECRSLKQLTLNGNKLTYLGDDLFDNLRKLDILNLENNHLTDISATVLAPFAILKTLNLGNNDIKAIDIDAFDKLGELIDLNLSNNRLTYLNLTTFQNQKELKRLNLAQNEIWIENGGADATFANFLHNLEELDVSYNRLDSIPTDFLATKTKMQRLAAVNNSMTTFDFFTMQGAISNVVVDVSSNQISTIDNMLIVSFESAPPHFAKQLIIANNPIACNGSNYELFRYFTGDMDKNFSTTYDIRPIDLFCASPPEMAGLPFIQKNPCELPYSLSHCPNNCDCYHVPLDNTATVDCRNRNLTTVPRLFTPTGPMYESTREHCHLTEENTAIVKVILKENRLKHIETNSFHNITVSILDVSFNNLSAISWVPHGLTSLQLDHNDLSRINKTLLEDLDSVTLDHNPWICDCETVPFWIYLTDTIIPNKVDVRCFESNRTIRFLSRESLCPSYAKLIITLVVVAAIVILIPAIFLIFFYKYKQEIKVWLFAHNMCLWFVREEDLDKDKIYDAFVSFSQKDEAFIVDHIVPRLETIPNPYKLCIHMRDFIPGEFIAKQVAESVLNSRRTIVVLSSSFLESVWGKIEFRAAHTTAIKEGIARVIIIIYDDLDLNDERIDDELRVYLNTNTYIKWGDPWFWDKLKYALPHRKGGQSSYTNKKFDQITVNIDRMDKIDQKLDQNVNVNIIKGTSSIDTLLMKSKKDGLFNPNDDNDTPPAEKGIV